MRLHPILVAVVLSTLVACGSKAAPATSPTASAAPPDAAAPVDDMETFIAEVGGHADSICQCKDTACAEHRKAKLDALGDSAKARFGERKPSDAQMETLVAAMTRVQTCIGNLAADQPAEEDASLDAPVAKFGEFADRICQCKDTACADAVQQELMAYGKSVDAQYAHAKPSQRQTETMMRAAERMQGCVAKLAP